MRALSLALLFVLLPLRLLADPLPSWTEGQTKARIIGFVESVTTPGSPDYLDPSQRIAVFDNDGTLWAEQPMYFQFMFALDRFREMAAADPSLASSDVLKAAAAGDMKGVMAGGEHGLLDIVAATHADIPVEELRANAAAWLATAKNPVTGMRYVDMTYQPMLELLTYLREEGFGTYIVSGGGIQFIRAYSDSAYGIPPQNVVGSYLSSSYSLVDGVPTVMQEDQIAFIDDKSGKPEGIERHIGQRPVIAVGNSDGDFDMLQWTTAGAGPRLGVLIHHTDAKREFAYDRDSPVGRLARGLDEGPGLGWIIVDMAQDWSRVYSAPAP